VRHSCERDQLIVDINRSGIRQLVVRFDTFEGVQLVEAIVGEVFCINVEKSALPLIDVAVDGLRLELLAMIGEIHSTGQGVSIWVVADRSVAVADVYKTAIDAVKAVVIAVLGIFNDKFEIYQVSGHIGVYLKTDVLPYEGKIAITPCQVIQVFALVNETVAIVLLTGAEPR